MEIEVKKTVQQTTQLSLTRDDLLDFLTSRGLDLSSDARFWVEVPGGGDWSNTQLDIVKDVVIHVFDKQEK